MEWVGGVNRIVRASMLMGLVALLLPTVAGAQTAPEGDSDELPDGITVTGIGFAPTMAFAADHALRDARNRAAAIATALRVELGGPEAVYMPELTRFAGSSQRCGDRGGRPAGCRKAATAIVTFGVVGGATSADVLREVGSTGTASVPVEPRDRTSDRWIKRAIVTARSAATEEAAATARLNAKVAAKAAGLRLGPLVSVTETSPPSYLPLPFTYVPAFQDPLLGRFGPGIFCRVTRQPVVRFDPETGRPELVRQVRRRRCAVPRTYETYLEIRYSAT